MTKETRQLSPFENRGAGSYGVLLFPEEPFKNGIRNAIVDWSLEKTNMNRYRKFEFYGRENGYKAVEASREDILQHYGGQKVFFRKGSKILDLGSGYGKAVYEFDKSRKGIEIIGLDPRYNHEKPFNMNNGEYVGGKAEDLPFMDNTFTGILSCESFPRHVPDYLTAERIVSEVTRVAKEGAVWRATMALLSEDETIIYDYDEPKLRETNKANALGSLYREFGWEFYYSPKKLLIARLEHKV